MSEWPMVKLGNVIKVVDTTEYIEHPTEETFITLKMHGNGAVKRNIGDGKTPKPFRGFRAKAGQFIYSRIDARNGAFGLIPAELNNAVVSKDFPLYNINEAKIIPSLLVQICTSDQFINQIKSLSNGATNRQRIKEEILENLTIPLPPLDKQKRIAEILLKVGVAIKKTEQQITLTKILKEAEYNSLSNEIQDFKPLKTIGINKVTGKSIVAKSGQAHNKNRVIKVSAVSSGSFIPSESKPLPADYIPNESHKINQGDLLFARASGSAKLLGACCIVEQQVENLYLPDKVWKLEVNEEILPKAYLLQALRSKKFRAIAESLFSSSTGVKNIKSSVLMDFTIPIPTRNQLQDFSNFIAFADSLSISLYRKLTLLQELQRSLSARAFAGLL